MSEALVSLILNIVGFIIIAIQSPMIALGVFLVIWASNIEEGINRKNLAHELMEVISNEKA